MPSDIAEATETTSGAFAAATLSPGTLLCFGTDYLESNIELHFSLITFEYRSFCRGGEEREKGVHRQRAKGLMGGENGQKMIKL